MITRSVRQQSILNFFWVPINFQTSAILTIAVPAALLRIPGINHTAVLALLASAVAAVAMLVPPVVGAISDGHRRRGGQRRPVVLIGAAVNVAGLLWMSHANSLTPFAGALLVAVLGQSISLAAYQPLIPEVVARSDWGLASGYQGIASLVGSVAGLGIASVFDPSAIFLWTAGIVILGAAMVAATPEGRFVDGGEHARVGNWYNFVVTFVSRFFTNFGLTLLMTFVLYFFHDVLKAENPSAGTGFFGGLALVGAIATSLWMGHMSDKVARKKIVALAGIPMALAVVGFAAAPGMRFIAELALLFGLGYGAFVSTGWALAIDSVPQLRDVARDLGLWGIASGLPGMLAPVFGAWLLARYASPLHGYQALFITAALCFLVGSAVVMLVGRRTNAARA